MYDPQSSVVLEEQNALNQLQARSQELLSFLNSYPQRGFWSREQIETVLRTMGQWGKQAYSDFASKAQRLSGMGHPQLSQQLYLRLHDLGQAAVTYVQLYLNMLNASAQQQAIWQQAEQKAVQNFQAATLFSTKTFEQYMRSYFDIVEERCYYCGRYIGVPGGGVCPECVYKLRMGEL